MSSLNSNGSNSKRIVKVSPSPQPSKAMNTRVNKLQQFYLPTSKKDAVNSQQSGAKTMNPNGIKFISKKNISPSPSPSPSPPQTHNPKISAKVQRFYANQPQNMQSSDKGHPASNAVKTNTVKISHKRSENISPGSGSGSPVEDESNQNFKKPEIVRIATKAGANYMTNR